METGGIGKMLIIMGVVLICVGGVVLLANKIPFLGKLPGDIYIKREHFTFYFPLATSVLVSAVLSLLFWLWSRR
ncbi:MAG: DUF2905 domain-containing protein [Candidatus Omnitrophica bacterium]|nr:DUF2905 domain-containing protein [Candidatus Omnitrophota bacterium]